MPLEIIICIVVIFSCIGKTEWKIRKKRKDARQVKNVRES